MIKILIVEDDKAISNLIQLSLKKEGFSCTCALDGKDAADLISENHYDLILLDIMLPEIDGFELMNYIRPMEIPVIFLTAKADVADRVKGLRAGAEDYMVKPFEIAELLARIDVVLRRFQKNKALIEIDDLKIDTGSLQVWKNGQEVSLTRKEFDLLILFARNPRRALYRENIYEQVWGEEFPYGSKTVDLHVQRLRRKVGWQSKLIAVSKIGYRLEI